MNILEFLDDSFSNNEEIIKRPILPKKLNIKHSMTKYKMKLEERKKKEKNHNINNPEKEESEKSSSSFHTPIKWRPDADKSGN